MNVQEIAEHIEARPPGPLYLFCPGKAPRGRNTTFEPLLADRAIDRMIESTVDPDNRDFAFSAYYADETAPAEIVMDAQTLPFLADRRVILVRNAERYSSEAAAGALLSYLESPNDSTVLLMIANKIDKRTKFYKACEKSGVIVECPALAQQDVVEWVNVEVRTRNKKIDSAAVRELVDRAGTHLSDVENALTLAVNYVGDDQDRITEEDVRAACADVAEEEIWALTDAIAASRSGEALSALRRLVDLGKHPDEIIGTINWLLKSAYAVAIAEGEPNISRFVARKVGPLTQKLGETKLRSAFALCTDTQFMMRSTGVDSGLALDLLVVKLAAPIKRRRTA